MRAITEEEVMMSTSELIIEPILGLREPVGQLSAELSSAVSISRSINADRQRLFQALTVSEFIEAWFCAPGATLGSTEVSACFRSFQVSYREHYGIRNRFLCAYRVMRRSKVQFTWKSDAFPESAPSLVTFRLQGDFARTTLYLSHTGLSRRDHPWHSRLWEGSLDKLARLF
ncbi:MAG TPA: SRPBCC domain-containing protein [Terracidiphilus sp.]